MKITPNYYYPFCKGHRNFLLPKIAGGKISQEDITLVDSVYLVILGHEALPWGCSRPMSDCMGCVECGRIT